MRSSVGVYLGTRAENLFAHAEKVWPYFLTTFSKLELFTTFKAIIRNIKIKYLEHIEYLKKFK
jgi:hypothetical protein